MDTETRELLAAVSTALNRAESTAQPILASEVALAQVLQGGGDPGQLARWLRDILASGQFPLESELPLPSLRRTR